MLWPTPQALRGNLTAMMLEAAEGGQVLGLFASVATCFEALAKPLAQAARADAAARLREAPVFAAAVLRASRRPVASGTLYNKMML